MSTPLHVDNGTMAPTFQSGNVSKCDRQLGELVEAQIELSELLQRVHVDRQTLEVVVRQVQTSQPLQEDQRIRQAVQPVVAHV